MVPRMNENAGASSAGAVVHHAPRRATAGRMWHSFLAAPRAPLLALGLLSVVSLGTRILWLSNPQVLLFDENYYVNAARKMLSLPVPSDGIYTNRPPGLDPNTAHPPLGKLLIASGIFWLGDRPVGWRAASVAFGTIAILAMYALARSARASPWVSLGAASLMAADPLFFIHARMGTLEIFVLTFMLLSAAAYLRGRPLVAGLVLGMGAAVKLLGFLALFVFGIYELLEALNRRSPGSALKDLVSGKRLGRLLLTASVALAAYLGVLFVIDLRFSTSRNPVTRTLSMVMSLSNKGVDRSLVDVGEPGIRAPGAAARGSSGPILRQRGQNLYEAPASRPWEWLLNRRQINYYRLPSPRGEFRSPVLLGRRTPDLVVFQGLINPAIIALALPALAVSALMAHRRRPNASFLPLAWFLGTFGAYLAIWLIGGGAGFIYYMGIVLPGIYLAVAQLLSAKKIPRALTLLFAATVALMFFTNFPFRSWGSV